LFLGQSFVTAQIANRQRERPAQLRPVYFQGFLLLSAVNDRSKPLSCQRALKRYGLNCHGLLGVCI
jgi:hypothetical protein